MDVLPDFQQKIQQMLKMLDFSAFWSKFEIFHFLAKFGSKPLVALEKRLYQKIWWGSKSIALKLSEGVFNLFFGPKPAEKNGVKFLSHKKRRFLYKKSSRKRGVHDM